MEDLLTVRELSKLTKVHPGHIRRLVSNRRIKFYKIPGIGIRFRLSDLEKMVEESAVEAIDWDQKAGEILHG